MNVLKQSPAITTHTRRLWSAQKKETNSLVTTAVMLTVLSLVAGRLSATAIPVENMRDWIIILPADAIESERYPAEELRTFFEEATGTEAEKRTARPHIGTFFELSRKHNAKMYSELKTVAFVEQGLRELY